MLVLGGRASGCWVGAVGGAVSERFIPVPPSLPTLPCLQWGPTGVSLRGQHYPLVRIHFTPQTGKPGAGASAPAQ